MALRKALKLGQPAPKATPDLASQCDAQAFSSCAFCGEEIDRDSGGYAVLACSKCGLYPIHTKYAPPLPALNFQRDFQSFMGFRCISRASCVSKPERTTDRLLPSLDLPVGFVIIVYMPLGQILTISGQIHILVIR
jgi:hypothetical protein